MEKVLIEDREVDSSSAIQVFSVLRVFVPGMVTMAAYWMDEESRGPLGGQASLWMSKSM